MTMGNSGMGNGNGSNGEKEKPKVVLAVGTFTARTKGSRWIQFDNSDRVLLGIDVEFVEGPNVGLSGTCIISMESMEFFANTLKACGWVEGMNPDALLPGVEVKAVVQTDTNPKTQEKRNVVRFLNDMSGRKSALFEKYGLDESGSKNMNKQFAASLAALVKSTGFQVPKAGAKPAQQQQSATKPAENQSQGDAAGAPAGDDSEEIPF